MSVPHTPTSITSTRASPGPGSGVGTSCTLPLPACPGVTTMARMAVTITSRCARGPGDAGPGGPVTCAPAMSENDDPRGAQQDVPPARRLPNRPDWLDGRAAIAIVIGLVSFSGALVTWKASGLSSNATTADRQSVLETVIRQQNTVSVETQLRFEEAAFARFQADSVNAMRLRTEANNLRTARDEVHAKQAEDDANRLEKLANIAVRDVDGGYIFYDEKSIPQFDEANRRLALQTADEAASQANPEQTVRIADRYRNRSQRMVTWLPVFILAIVGLTIAQVSRRPGLRKGLAGAS